MLTKKRQLKVKDAPCVMAQYGLTPLALKIDPWIIEQLRDGISKLESIVGTPEHDELLRQIRAKEITPSQLFKRTCDIYRMYKEAGKR